MRREEAVRVRRVYDALQPDDGRRVLVDRVWPRGRARDDLGLDAWARDLAPSDELRRWFGHDPTRWGQFRERYRTELQSPERQRLLDELAAAARSGRVTLLFGARDTKHNQAVVIAEELRARLRD